MYATSPEVRYLPGAVWTTCRNGALPATGSFFSSIAFRDMRTRLHGMVDKMCQGMPAAAIQEEKETVNQVLADDKRCIFVAVGYDGFDTQLRNKDNASKFDLLMIKYALQCMAMARHATSETRIHDVDPVHARGRVLSMPVAIIARPGVKDNAWHAGNRFVINKAMDVLLWRPLLQLPPLGTARLNGVDGTRT